MAAGIPILRALDALREQVWVSPYLNVICGDLSKSVSEGHRLSAALSKHPRVFSETYVSLVKAGESSGTLMEILSRLSSYLERNYRIAQKLKSALVYPALVFTLSLTMVFLMCSLVLPMFLQFFDGLSLRMPAATRGMIAVATAIGNPWVMELSHYAFRWSFIRCTCSLKSAPCACAWSAFYWIFPCWERFLCSLWPPDSAGPPVFC